jgi:hypothetical protein
MQTRVSHLSTHTIALLFLVAVVGASMLGMGTARAGRLSLASEDQDADGIDDGVEKLNHRSLDVQTSSSEVQITSESQSGDVHDKIAVHVTKENGSVEFDLSYSSSTSSAESEIQFNLCFDRIIEYYDANDDGIYNSTEDIPVQQMVLDSFGDLDYAQMVMPDGVNVHHINASTAGGVFSIDAWIGDGFFTINQTNVAPTQLKIDTRIQSFPFANASSRLAVVVTMEYQSEIFRDDETEDEKLGFDQDEEGIQTNPTPGNISGFFTWAAQSVVDGTPRAVLSSAILHGAEPAHVVYLNYPRGNLVVHDPKVGFSGIIRLPGPNNLIGTIMIVVTIAIIGVLAFFGLMMTHEEYRNYLLTRTVFVNRGAHRLSMDDVLDNETRTRILDLIINQPGIHFKELLRNVNTTSSNLAWHIDVLETYKIIHKQRVGHFLIYYPYLDKNPFATLDPKIAKSKTTLDIFQLVADNPGMYQNEIARRMGLDHKTAKYHLDKLTVAELITGRKIGRRTRFFSVDIPKEIDEKGPVPK